MSCVYCGGKGPFTDEHVLTRASYGAGRGWFLSDTVCHNCNQLFRTYERAWTSAPGEALMRIAFGPAGRSHAGQAYQVHPSEHVFLRSPSETVAYEVEILRGLQPHLRPQFALTDIGWSVRASAVEDLSRFKTALDEFLSKREITIQKRRFPGNDRFRVAVLSKDDTFKFEGVDMRRQPANTWLDRFPKTLEIPRDPRISVDAHGRLRVRAITLKQVPSLFSRLIAHGAVSDGGGAYNGGDYQVAVSSGFDFHKVPRAFAKTAVNLAIYFEGVRWASHQNFQPVIRFCLGGPDAKSPFFGAVERRTGIREIDEAEGIAEVHALGLISNGANVIALIRLYGGSVFRIHLGTAPPRSLPFSKFVWIDYNGSGLVSPFTRPPKQTFAV